MLVFVNYAKKRELPKMKASYLQLVAIPQFVMTNLALYVDAFLSILCCNTLLFLEDFVLIEKEESLRENHEHLCIGYIN